MAFWSDAIRSKAPGHIVAERSSIEERVRKPKSLVDDLVRRSRVLDAQGNTTMIPTIARSTNLATCKGSACRAAKARAKRTLSSASGTTTITVNGVLLVVSA